MTPATPFRFERLMLASIAASLPRVLRIRNSQTVRILREPLLGRVIPDLLLGTWRPGSQPMGYAGATRVDAHVWALLDRCGAMTRPDLCDQLHLSSAGGAAAFTRMLRARVVIDMGDDRLALNVRARTSLLQIVAFEAKLTRWPDAVEQAKHYRSFADRSFVVLDGNRVSMSETLRTAVRRAGVGLILQFGRVLRLVAAAPVVPHGASPARVAAITKLVTPRGGRALRHRAGTT